MSHSIELQKALQELEKTTGILLSVDEGQDESQVLHQIKSLTGAYKEKYNKIHFLKSLLIGDMPISEAGHRAAKFYIPVDESRYLLLIEMNHKEQEIVMEILKNIFPSRSKIFLIPVSEQHIAILHPTKRIGDVTDLEKMCRLIIQSLGAEAYVYVRVSYSERLEHLNQLADAFRKCALAIHVGKLFYTERTVLSYHTLGIGRLIYELPKQVCEDFLYEIYGEELPGLEDEESLNVVAQFIRNNLNIAETARQLHMHRNTLIYRLEQIEKRTGLDLRIFEDAMTYHVASMVLSYLRHKGS